MSWFGTQRHSTQKKILHFLLFISISIFSLSFFFRKKTLLFSFVFHLFSFSVSILFILFVSFEKLQFPQSILFFVTKKKSAQNKIPAKANSLTHRTHFTRNNKKKEKKGNKHRAKLKHQSKQIFKKKKSMILLICFVVRPQKKITKPHQSIICLDLFFK